jgi:glycogen synthase
MKIAYISYEFPPDTAFGGIATYMWQVSGALRRNGWQVEVFCASETKESLNETMANGVLVHRIHCTQRHRFKDLVLAHFSKRHAAVNFDVVESPEYNADALRIKQQFSQLPLLVKFHTPSFFVKELNRAYRPKQLKETVKKWLGIKQYRFEKDEEYQLALLASQLSAPSEAMRQVVCEKWKIAPERIEIVPNLFVPGNELLRIAPGSETPRISFIGRLEVRKGIVTLVKALPAVLRRHPQVRVCFIGQSNPAPNGKGLMTGFIKEQLKEFEHQLEFTSQVAPAEIAAKLAQSTVCVFPSLWEAAGYVCLEAMSAARGVVAGNIGGMKDMLKGQRCGLLVNPHSSEELSTALLQLLENPDEAIAMGSKARQRVLDYYGGEVVRQYEGHCIAAANK